MRAKKLIALCGQETERSFQMRMVLGLEPWARVVTVPDAQALAAERETPNVILCEHPSTKMLMQIDAHMPGVRVVIFGRVPARGLPLVDLIVTDGENFIPRLREVVRVAAARRRGPKRTMPTAEPRGKAVAA